MDIEKEFIEVIGSQSEKPAETDTSSSAYYVYERKNIEPYEEKDEREQVRFTGWKYLERKIPREQYTVEMSAKIKELEAVIGQLKEDNLTLMLGLADLYEGMM